MYVAHKPIHIHFKAFCARVRSHTHTHPACECVCVCVNMVKNNNILFKPRYKHYDRINVYIYIHKYIIKYKLCLRRIVPNVIIN